MIPDFRVRRQGWSVSKLHAGQEGENFSEVVTLYFEVGIVHYSQISWWGKSIWQDLFNWEFFWLSVTLYQSCCPGRLESYLGYYYQFIHRVACDAGCTASTEHSWLGSQKVYIAASDLFYKPRLAWHGKESLKLKAGFCYRMELIRSSIVTFRMPECNSFSVVVVVVMVGDIL